MLPALRRIDYFEVRLGRLVYRGWPSVPPYEKGVDIRLGTDMLAHGVAENYDVAILVSGDSDFADAVQAVKDRGLHVEAALFPASGSQRLRDVVDKVTLVDLDFLGDCWI
ncbi:MAG: NYN domain-containing protein [Dehalococcoidia bacterium]|nr:NYN domain-containing protein [Dehalococcoidia bacterium]